MMVPTQQPVLGEPGLGLAGASTRSPGVGPAHRAGFPGGPGTPILAAAGGVVVTQEYHPEYGNMVEVDHGNDLVTRYAHASRVLSKRAT
jgi:murein DD-endopeptidase MepM/ murein hydrolase activator NlpD